MSSARFLLSRVRVGSVCGTAQRASKKDAGDRGVVWRVMLLVCSGRCCCAAAAAASSAVQHPTQLTLDNTPTEIVFRDDFLPKHALSGPHNENDGSGQISSRYLTIGAPLYFSHLPVVQKNQIGNSSMRRGVLSY